MPVKAVLDTQVIVRGILHRRTSAATQLLDMALAGERLRAVSSPPLLDEVSRVLREPAIRRLASPPLDDQLIERAVDYMAVRFEVTPGTFRDVDRVPDDAKDNPLVEAALEAGAESIVSDDNDLLSLKVVIVSGFRPVQIHRPTAFLKRLLAECDRLAEPRAPYFSVTSPVA